MGPGALDRERKRALRELQTRIGYRFKNLELLDQALRHRSFVHQKEERLGKDNERLEFLGDGLLGLCIGHLLMERRAEDSEGSLSRMRAAVVSETSLAQIARQFDLGSYLLLGKGEDQSGGREKNSILSSTLEAILGAIYLDGGFQKAQRVIAQLFSPYLEAAETEMWLPDYKTKLQEIMQATHKIAPRYIVAKEFGPAHAKIFGVKVRIQEKVMGFGAGRSKKEAEQRAARRALERLGHKRESAE
jgi:ribonuclease-3